MSYDERLVSARCSCGRPFTYTYRRGRPRSFCQTCRPPGDLLAGQRHWWSLHGHEVNAARRAAREAQKLGNGAA